MRRELPSVARARCAAPRRRRVLRPRRARRHPRHGHITFAGTGTGTGGGRVRSTPTNGGIVYQLDDGRDQGKRVYVGENVMPTVKAGDMVHAGQPSAAFAPPGGTGCIEISWASGPGSPSPIALQHGGFQEGSGCAAWRTAAGDNMSDLIHSLGGPYGTCRNQPIDGHYP